jgi:hypothetical protein
LRREEQRGGNEARAALEALRAESRPYNPMTDYRSPLAPVTNSFRQGLSFGFMDELSSGLRAAAAAPFSDRTFGEIYDDSMAEQHAELARGRREHPIVSAVGEIGGALLPTTGLGGVATTIGKNVPNWLKVAALGGAEGAIYGAGSAQDDRLTSAAAGGAVGAIAAPLVSTLSAPLLTAGRNLFRTAYRGLTNTPRRQAERLVSESLQADLANPDTVQSLARMRAPMVLADAGENLAGRARGAAATPGAFRALAHQTLRARQTGQQSRLIESMGVRGTRAFKDSFDDWANSRIRAASPFYDQAYSSGLDLTSPQMQGLLQRPAMVRALRRAETKIRNEGGRRGHVALMDAAKRALDDDIGTAMRAGKADEARILGTIKRELVAEVDRQVPVYAQARSIFAGESALREAADFGADLFKRNVSHDEARRLVADMSASELEAFRRGALRGLVEQLEMTAENRNVAAKLTESVAMRDKLSLLFPNGGDFENFVQQAADEARMSYTKNVVLGGSPTARIQEETRDLMEAGQMLTEVSSGGGLSVLARVLRGFGYGDVPEDVLSELGELLLKPQSRQTIDRLVGMANQAAPVAVNPATRATAGGMAAVAGGALAGGSAEERRRQKLLEALRAGPEQLVMP